MTRPWATASPVARLSSTRSAIRRAEPFVISTLPVAMKRSGAACSSWSATIVTSPPDVWTVTGPWGTWASAIDAAVRASRSPIAARPSRARNRVLRCPRSPRQIRESMLSAAFSVGQRLSPAVTRSTSPKSDSEPATQRMGVRGSRAARASASGTESASSTATPCGTTWRSASGRAARGLDEAGRMSPRPRGGQRDERVRGLVDAEQRQPQPLEPPARSRAVDGLGGEAALPDAHAQLASLHEQRHADGGGARDQHLRRLRRLRGGHGDAAPDDRGLLGGDGGERLAEHLLVVEVDARQRRHRRRPDGGGVEPSAESDLQHGDVDGLTREVIERERRARLEHGGVQTGHQGGDRVEAVGDGVLRDGLAVDTDPFAERHEVRRGVEAHAAAVRLEDGGEHGGHRALAVGAGDLDERVAAPRVAERLQQRLDALEAGAHPRVLAAAQGEEPGDRLGVGHARSGGGSVGCSAKKARRRRSVSLRSRRSTTRSSWPCSRRNSERWKPSGSGWRIVSAMTRGPAKPMSARGSATMTSPSIAKDAVTPPVVGSVSTDRYGSPASASRSSAAEVFAICMSERMPSCMRAPPEAERMMTGRSLSMASSIARVSFSPTTQPMLPPR